MDAAFEVLHKNQSSDSWFLHFMITLWNQKSKALDRLLGWIWWLILTLLGTSNGEVLSIGTSRFYVVFTQETQKVLCLNDYSTFIILSYPNHL